MCRTLLTGSAPAAAHPPLWPCSTPLNPATALACSWACQRGPSRLVALLVAGQLRWQRSGPVRAKSGPCHPEEECQPQLRCDVHCSSAFAVLSTVKLRLKRFVVLACTCMHMSMHGYVCVVLQHVIVQDSDTSYLYLRHGKYVVIQASRSTRGPQSHVLNMHSSAAHVVKERECLALP